MQSNDRTIQGFNIIKTEEPAKLERQFRCSDYLPLTDKLRGWKAPTGQPYVPVGIF